MGQPSSPGGAPPETVDTIQALVDNAQRLGLTWTVRPAEVFSVSADGTEITATLDGDDTPIAMFSMMSTRPLPGQRVFVFIVPPAVNYIIGPATGPWSMLPPRVDRVTNVAGILAETSVLTTVTGVFQPYTVYGWRAACRIDMAVGGFVSTALRKNTTAGTLIFGGAFFGVPVGIQWIEWSGFFKVGATPVTTALTATIAASAAATLTASATGVAYLDTYIAPGAPSRYANAFLLT